jgi:hypothetical protein
LARQPVRYRQQLVVLALSHRKVQFPGPHSNGISESYFNGNSDSYCDSDSYIYPHGYGDGNCYSYVHSYAYADADANGKLQLHIHHRNGRVCASRC